MKNEKQGQFFCEVRRMVIKVLGRVRGDHHSIYIVLLQWWQQKRLKMFKNRKKRMQIAIIEYSSFRCSKPSLILSPISVENSTSMQIINFQNLVLLGNLPINNSNIIKITFVRCSLIIVVMHFEAIKIIGLSGMEAEHLWLG